MGFDIDNYEDAIDYTVSEIGEEFEEALKIANAIIANPGDYTGPQAAVTAIKLSAYRYKIGVAGAYWQHKSVGNPNRTVKMKKDALKISYDALQEIINTLKLTARHDHQLAQNSRGD